MSIEDTRKIGGGILEPSLVVNDRDDVDPLKVRDAQFIKKGSHGNQTLADSVYTPTIPDGAKFILVQAQAQNIYYTIDGTDPTSSSGFLLVADSNYPIMIPVGGSLDVAFYRAASGAILAYQFIGY